MEMYEGKMLFAEFDNQWNAAEDGPTKHGEEYSQDTRHKWFTQWGHNKKWTALYDGRGKTYIFLITNDKKSDTK